MIIPKNSEIAVESVKINKNGLLSINRANSTYAIYLGLNLKGENTLANTIYNPIIVSVVDSTSPKELTINEFADEVLKSINRGLNHPNFLTLVPVNNQQPLSTQNSVVPKYNLSTGAFEGYTISIEQSTGISDVIPSFVITNKKESLFTYNAGVLTSTNPKSGTTGGATVVLSDFPVALNSTGTTGEDFAINVDITKASDFAQSGWCVGLSRYNEKSTYPTNGTFKAFSPSYFDNQWTAGGGNGFAWKQTDQFYDYVIVKQATFLRVFQAVVVSSRAPTQGDRTHIVMKEIEYWTFANSILAGAGPYDIFANASGYTNVGWRISGDKVEPYIGKTSKTLKKIIDLDDATITRAQSTKPRGNYLDMLYAKLWIRKQNGELTIDFRNKATQLLDFQYGNFNADYIANAISNGVNVKIVKAIENRQFLDFTNSNTTKYSFQGIDAVHKSFVSIQPNLILAPNNEYGREMTDMCSAQYILGFTGVSLLNNPTLSNNDKTFSYSSVVIPRMISPKSLFIRLTNFTHQTANAKQGSSTSKLLAHLPRFDNAGNETGGLYFQPNRLYVKLNNPNDLYITNFDVDITYDDETYAECLTGKTIVCFHIRDAEKN
tara:strand:- start:2272 stop:4086 length:1815 start_codon:yes stop_codon:yes gene_type:complete